MTEILNSMICCSFCVISKLKLVPGTLLSESSYYGDHKNVTVESSSLKVLFKAVTGTGVPTL